MAKSNTSKIWRPRRSPENTKKTSSLLHAPSCEPRRPSTRKTAVFCKRVKHQSRSKWYGEIISDIHFMCTNFFMNIRGIWLKASLKVWTRPSGRPCDKSEGECFAPLLSKNKWKRTGETFLSGLCQFHTFLEMGSMCKEERAVSTRVSQQFFALESSITIQMIRGNHFWYSFHVYQFLHEHLGNLT